MYNRYYQMKRANTIRLVKEEQQLLKDPIQFAVVRRKDHSNFHFCLFGLDDDYEGGFYHGVWIAFIRGPIG